MSKRWLNHRAELLQGAAIEARTRQLLDNGAISSAIWDDVDALRAERARVSGLLKVTIAEGARTRMGHILEVIERRLSMLNQPTITIAMNLPDVDVYLRRRSG